MFVTERYQKIQQILLEYKRADVSRLSKLLSVSEVTIRKDLEHLEKSGFLIRTHGGAVLNEGPVASESLDYQIDPDELEHKQMIGSIVSQLVSNGDFIYLGCGTTCIEVARCLKSKQILTVITNNISAAIELSNNSDIAIITTGGNLIKKITYFH